MDESIERDAYCFCCGADNERGLHLSFSYPREGRAESSLVLPDYFSGWKGIAHGGFLSMLLDEVMAQACASTARGSEAAVTGEMRVRFKKPAKTGSLVRIEGDLEEARGRIMRTRGRILDEAGEVLAEASASFLKV